MKTKVHYPFVYTDNDNIYANVTINYYWNSSFTIFNILMSLMSILYAPYFYSPLNGTEIDL